MILQEPDLACFRPPSETHQRIVVMSCLAPQSQDRDTADSFQNPHKPILAHSLEHRRQRTPWQPRFGKSYRFQNQYKTSRHSKLLRCYSLPIPPHTLQKLVGVSMSHLLRYDLLSAEVSVCSMTTAVGSLSVEMKRPQVRRLDLVSVEEIDDSSLLWVEVSEIQ